MPTLVANGAMLQCSFGAAPSTLIVLPEKQVMGGKMPAATIMDNVPMKNILPFSMCITQSNPAVASATAAALGVPTPAPCVPVVPAPWVPGSTGVMVGKVPALTDSCTAMCTYGGVINITSPGPATTVSIGR